mgnify:CR=1 FL=1
MSGILGSVLNSEELSITTQPDLAAILANLLVASDPTAKRAISQLSNLNVSKSCVFSVLSPKKKLFEKT